MSVVILDVKGDGACGIHSQILYFSLVYKHSKSNTASKLQKLLSSKLLSQYDDDKSVEDLPEELLNRLYATLPGLQALLQPIEERNQVISVYSPAQKQLLESIFGKLPESEHCAQLKKIISGDKPLQLTAQQSRQIYYLLTNRVNYEVLLENYSKEQLDKDLDLLVGIFGNQVSSPTLGELKGYITQLKDDLSTFDQSLFFQSLRTSYNQLKDQKEAKDDKEDKDDKENGFSHCDANDSLDKDLGDVLDTVWAYNAKSETGEGDDPYTSSQSYYRIYRSYLVTVSGLLKGTQSDFTQYMHSNAENYKGSMFEILDEGSQHHDLFLGSSYDLINEFFPTKSSTALAQQGLNFNSQISGQRISKDHIGVQPGFFQRIRNFLSSCFKFVYDFFCSLFNFWSSDSECDFSQDQIFKNILDTYQSRGYRSLFGYNYSVDSKFYLSTEHQQLFSCGLGIPPIMRLLGIRFHHTGSDHWQLSVPDNSISPMEIFKISKNNNIFFSENTLSTKTLYKISGLNLSLPITQSAAKIKEGPA